ncbi:MAG: hypothetical protein FJZ09_03200 [Candidatus Omnitrophica bacterium]|nr:hypothetical protein [Candidatus Omnitrophota bacterium]
MKKINPEALATPFFAAFIICSFLTPAYTQGSSREMVKEIEQKEKQQPGIRPQDQIERPAVEYKATDLRDPFLELGKDVQMPSSQITPAKEAVQPPPLKVQGLIWGSSLPQAIINDSVVKQGDTIGGARIIDIDKNGVVVEFQGQEFNISAPAAGGEPVTGQ